MSSQKSPAPAEAVILHRRLQLIAAVMKRLRKPENHDLATLLFWLGEIDLILDGGRDARTIGVTNEKKAGGQ
jgi:hypothetical protein